MTAFVIILANGSLEIRTPYSAEFVADLKDTVPYDFRKWVPAEKIWTVHHAYAQLAIQIIRRHYADVSIDDKRHQSPPPPPPNFATSSDPFRVLFLIPTAPGSVITAAYRALARMHHPDNGGETKTMQTINAAYDKLKDNAS